MAKRVNFCSFSAAELPDGKVTYNQLRAAVLKAGRFSAFEATETPSRAKLFDRLARDPGLVIDNNSVGYPWTKVTAR